jgi:hypothetical protein
VGKWCTVSIVDPDGCRHSLDLQADSSYDNAHIFLCHAREHPDKGLPRATLSTVFEVVVSGKVYRVEGNALQRWIVKRRSELNGPKGMLFKQRADAGIAWGDEHRA